MRLCGIDYSMNAPCLTLFEGDKFSFDKCQVHFLTSKQYLQDKFNNLTGHPYPEIIDGDNTVRFDKVSQWAFDLIKDFDPDYIALEGYSMNSEIGRAFDIAENTAFLKYKIFNAMKKKKIHTKNLPLLYPPTTVKKFAVGKGNSPKDPIILKFIEETGVNLHDLMGIKSAKLDVNPVSDIADSYFITKLLFTDASDLIS